MSRSIELTEIACHRIGLAVDRSHLVGGSFGTAEGDRLAASFGRALGSLIRMGGRIMADGTESFIARTESGMTVGMVFSPEPPRKTLDRRTDETLAPDLTDDELDAMFPFRSGEWSLHS